jgi:hypothetical protein
MKTSHEIFLLSLVSIEKKAAEEFFSNKETPVFLCKGGFIVLFGCSQKDFVSPLSFAAFFSIQTRENYAFLSPETHPSAYLLGNFLH